jgi:hypothetical protein|tara:strand:+ start:1750 stop:2070 length:321 start_codon:yes stop_codon:yes gene_type:complete
MGSLKRKLERNQEKKNKKATEKKMQDQLMMFDKLDDHCAACEKSFDRKSKEHASTWNVVVREKEDVVRLYCPECWDRANKLVEEIQNDFRVQEERKREESDEGESK